MARLALAVLAAALLATAASAAWAAPPFCKGLECPKYTVVKKIGDDIELRRYEPASWASTKVCSMDMDQAMRGSFMKLFNYISGENAAKSKIDMTAPVVTKIEPGQGPACNSNFTISFYNPVKYQASSTPAPKPSAADVFISSTPAMEVYVLSYGGWPSADAVTAKAAELTQKLTAAGEKFSAAPYYSAGYDSPMTVFNRHNEVWIPKAAAATTNSSAKSGRRML